MLAYRACFVGSHLLLCGMVVKMTEEQAAAYKAAEDRIDKLLLKMQKEHARHEWNMSLSLWILALGIGLLVAMITWRTHGA